MRSGLIAIAGGVVLLFIAARGPDGPIVVPIVVPPDPLDMLDEWYAYDRQHRVDMLLDMESTEHANDAAKAEWHLEHSRKILNAGGKSYTEALAEAIVAGTVKDFAESLRRE